VLLLFPCSLPYLCSSSTLYSPSTVCGTQAERRTDSSLSVYAK
jgi:hypothetical protein